MMWIKCNECGNETHPDLKDCTCESCDALDWSEPYADQFGEEKSKEPE